MAKNRKTFFAAMTLLVILGCMATIAVFSGFRHSALKYGSMLVSVILVFMFHFLIGDPILFVLLSISDTFWPTRPLKFATAAEVGHQTRIDYLKLRVKSLQAHLRIPEKYRNEELNGKYKLMVRDLWVYGWYFVFLVLMVGALHARSAYYNKKNIEQLFSHNHSVYYGLNEVNEVSDAYEFIISSLINAFHPETANGTSAPLWVHAEQTLLLGVVRLRQLRTTDWHDRQVDPPLSAEKYLPGWAFPYEHVPNDQVYWHIYSPWIPWIPQGTKDASELKLNDENVAIMKSPTDSSGYVAFLARTKQYSLDVVEYLRANKWLNYNTSALFMEFSLYSPDANLLTMCALRVEQTPFGGVIPHVRTKSFFLVEHFENLSISEAILIIGYMIVFVQFLKTLTLKLWFEPGSIRKIWNKVDVAIVLLNVLVVILFIMQDRKVSKMLKQLEVAPKSEYVHVQDVALIDDYIRMFFGLLLCMTTLRLGKALQISHVFSYTLSLVWKAVASVAIAIFIFILGFGLAVCTINGNSSLNLSALVRSIVTCTYYAFGFGVGLNMNHFFYGGMILGCILFAILAFVITIMLMNVFVSLISDNFPTAKDQRDARVVRRISLFEFILAESLRYTSRMPRLRAFRQFYERKTRTISENVSIKLKSIITRKQVALRSKTFGGPREMSQPDLKVELEEFRNKQERIYTLGALINTQIDILEAATIPPVEK